MSDLIIFFTDLLFLYAIFFLKPTILFACALKICYKIVGLDQIAQRISTKTRYTH